MLKEAQKCKHTQRQHVTPVLMAVAAAASVSQMQHTGC